MLQFADFADTPACFTLEICMFKAHNFHFSMASTRYSAKFECSQKHTAIPDRNAAARQNGGEAPEGASLSLSKRAFDKLGGRGSTLPRHCHPLQFLLKPFRFPGAKTAGKRFLLWKMRFSAAKIAPCPPYTPLGTVEVREGFDPLELSRSFRPTEALRSIICFFAASHCRLILHVHNLSGYAPAAINSRMRCCVCALSC